MALALSIHSSSIFNFFFLCMLLTEASTSSSSDVDKEWPAAPSQVQALASSLPTHVSEKMKRGILGLSDVRLQVCGTYMACQDSDVGVCGIDVYRRRRLLDAFKDGIPVSCDAAHKDEINEKRAFQRKDLSTGSSFYFPHMYTAVPPFVRFLPHGVAKSIPFALEELPVVFEALNIHGRLKASMARSLQSCMAPPSAVETKACVTSMSDMHQFVSKQLGDGPLHVISSDDANRVQGGQVKVSTRQLILNANTIHVSCHKLQYPYLVLYCHSVRDTEVYKVRVVNKAGADATFLLECHQDRSFCHFTSSGDLVFIKAN